MRVAKADNIRCADILLKAKADVDAMDKEGNTALHHSAMKDSHRVGEKLIEAGADVDAENKKAENVLFTAINHGSPKVRKLESMHILA